MAKVLVVDDELDVRDYLATTLQEEGFDVSAVEDGDGIIESLKRFTPDIILLDYKMPKVSGVDVIRFLKAHQEYNTIPIIMVTGIDGEDEKVQALELGADDYIVKPFMPRELGARIKAVLRRSKESLKEVENVSAHGININLRSHKASIGEKELSLTLTEFKILAELIRKKGQVLSRDDLRQSALGNLNVSDRTIDVHMASLRKKISDRSRLVQTVRGVGYRMADEKR